MEQRVITLEERFAFQDKHLEELDRIVQEFGARVEVLERKLKLLEQSGGGQDIGPADEPPPHY